MSACPSAATIARLANDTFHGQVPVLLEEHIESCDACQLKLEQLRDNELGTDGASLSLPCRDAPPRIPGIEIECEIGRGGMGVVYQAFQPSLNRRVAVKVVRSGTASGSRDHARWLREARAVSRVRHPNVVPLYAVGEADGWLYMVLELVPDGTLEQRLKVPYAPGDAARLLETIARAVEVIHRADLLHLDLKPSNVLLDGLTEAPRELAVPRVVDFGIAYRWDEPDASLAMASLAGPMGTPSYMAPEQVTGDRSSIGPATDIYGLGALLYHLLTGRPPFSAPSVAETLEQVRHQEPVSPRRLNPSIPRDLETICLKCLQKDPARRYASAEALADDLSRWQEGRSIKARPVSIPEMAWRACRRRPAVAALAIALLFTLCTGFLGMFVLWRHAESKRKLAEKESRIAGVERTRAEAQRIRAEAERTRAEADLEVARVALYEFSMLIGDQSKLKKMVESRAALIPFYQQLRLRLAGVATRWPEHLLIHSQLAWMDHGLANLLREQERLDEARAFFESSLANWDKVVSAAPEHPGWSSHRLITLEAFALLIVEQGRLAIEDGKIEQGAGYLAQAVAEYELRNLQPSAYTVIGLVDCRWRLAVLLARRNEPERAQGLIVANLRMLDDVRVEVNNPQITIRHVFAHDDLRRFNVNSSSEPRKPVGAKEGDALSRLLSPEADHLSAETWGELLVEVLRSTPGGGNSPSLETEAGHHFTNLLAERAAAERSFRHLDEARRIADRVHAFASHLAARYANEPAAYLALGEAYMQFYKNAWQIQNWATIERNLRLSIDSTQHALLLDPEHAVARVLLEQRQHRLEGLPETKRAYETPKQTVHAASRVGS